jgi:hypothetical protein
MAGRRLVGDNGLRQDQAEFTARAINDALKHARQLVSRAI